jgi:hypothetical protein
MNGRATKGMAASRDGSGSGPRLFRRYLAIVCAFMLTASGGVLTLNAAVDPLWYGRGNIVTGENFAFNERVAKLNLFLRHSDRYDCLIFGSSRTTLLDQTRIAGHTCANLAFSSGVVTEFIAYARYIKARGFSPKLVIVGVDAFNFWRDMTPELPDFVARGAPPPGWLRAYLSAGALNFSRRTLQGDSPFVRYYDDTFVGRVGPDAPMYDPPAPAELTAKGWSFDAARQDLYFELREIFPQARFVGYVPPVSAWLVVEELYLARHIEQYLNAMAAIAGRFDAMYDFSIPSEITMRPENTYDGDHYGAAVNAAIADVLQGKAGDFGFAVRGAPFPVYARAYEDAIVGFLQDIGSAGRGDIR